MALTTVPLQLTRTEIGTAARGEPLVRLLPRQAHGHGVRVGQARRRVGERAYDPPGGHVVDADV
ncbi:hypothetical protein ABZW02_36165, partial [Streptomyces sp. NPDC005180]|uniref:hypothetical protein n=1 Tax=Streptomyces sp. NPDC005180 TaxID=3156868 RepID=UPI00339F3997